MRDASTESLNFTVRCEGVYMTIEVHPAGCKGYHLAVI